MKAVHRKGGKRPEWVLIVKCVLIVNVMTGKYANE